MNGKGYGMPSSHAQFVFFFATYLTLWCLLRNRFLTRSERLFVAGASIALACCVASARVYLMYHTPKQVLVGVGAGYALGCAWFFTTAVMKGLGGGFLW